jgi:hypothetical protein
MPQLDQAGMLDAVGELMREQREEWNAALRELRERCESILAECRQQIEGLGGELRSYGEGDHAKVIATFSERMTSERLALAEGLLRAQAVFGDLTARLEDRLATLRDGSPGEPGKPGEPGRPGDPGQPGEPGADGTSLTPQGKWEAEKSYRRGDIVGWDGAAWIARGKTEPGDEPGKSGQFMIVAARGKDGAPGKPGKDGIGKDGAPGQDAPRLIECRIAGDQLAFADEAGGTMTCSIMPVLDALRETILIAVEAAATRFEAERREAK